MQHHPKPSPELKHLNFLVGKWHSEGTVLPTSSSPEIKIKGTDIYEWVSGGFFLLHRVDVLMGDEKVQAIEIIGGYDALSKTFPMRSFDNQGNFTTMQARVGQDGVMKITGEMMRSMLIADKDCNNMTAYWERSENGVTWMPWMDMKFSK